LDGEFGLFSIFQISAGNRSLPLIQPKVGFP